MTTALDTDRRRIPVRDVLRELGVIGEHLRRHHHWDEVPRPSIGGGRPVVLLPGWGADGRSMRHLRSYLDDLDFTTHDWGLGRNTGDFRRFVEPASARIREVSTSHRPPVLIGHSLGGWIAREIARNEPDHVSLVITLGAPATGGPRHTLLGTVVHARHSDVDNLEDDIASRFERPLTVPVIAIRSKRDGIVPAHISRDDYSPNVRHIDVESTHTGMPVNLSVLRCINEVIRTDDDPRK